MKAAVFKSFGSLLEVEDLPDPEPKSNELVLKVKACGICGTDLHMSDNRTAEGGWRLLSPGCVLGHEFSGEIVEIGRGVGDEWKTGQRVTALPWIGCGKCEPCRLGRPYRCSSVMLRSSLDLPGAYSEFCRVGANEALNLPDTVSFEQGALVEPMAVGFNAVQRANIKTKKPVFIMGAGPVGLSVALWCRFFGVEHVLISDLSGERAAASANFGATAVIDPANGDVSDQLLDHISVPPRNRF
jgi:Threonine dehydrogenase and related Zn-dependent dehydrogenases